MYQLCGQLAQSSLYDRVIVLDHANEACQIAIYLNPFLHI